MTDGNKTLNMYMIGYQNCVEFILQQNTLYSINPRTTKLFIATS